MRLRHRLLGLTILTAWFFGDVRSVQAHETESLDLHHGLGPLLADRLPALGLFAIVVLLTVLIVRRWRRREEIQALRWATLGVLALGWLALVGVQRAIAPRFPLGLDLAGKGVFLVTLVYVGYFVLQALRPFGRTVLVEPWARRGIVGTIAVYGAFLAYAMALVAPPDPTAPAPPSEGFFVVTQAFGPLASWPIVEWWLPGIGLMIGVSIGNGLLFATVVGLMGLNAALLAHNFRYRRVASSGSEGWVGGVGATALATSTSFCCCCFPALAPVIGAFLGTATAQALSLSLVQASGWWFNVAAVGMLLVPTWSIERAAARAGKSLRNC